MNNHKILSTRQHTQSPTQLAGVDDELDLEGGWNISSVDSSSEESSPLLEQKSPSKEDVLNSFFTAIP